MKYVHATNVDKMPWIKANWMHGQLIEELEGRNKQIEDRLNGGSI